MEVVEQFVLGKHADPLRCEDAVLVTAAHAAVIDGATDVHGRRYGDCDCDGDGDGDGEGDWDGDGDGVAGGRWAMQACAAAIGALPAGVDAHTAVEAMSRELASRLDPAMPAAERPSAAVTIYSAARREVWQAGDVGFAYSGLPPSVGRPRKRVDDIASSFRAALLAAEAATGNPLHRAADPARPVIRELIRRQGALRNVTGPYGYAGIDGRPVPPSLVVVHRVPDDVTELVLASDGYPVIGGTLAESEAELKRLLDLDPWCVRELAGTKAHLDGQASFDDRAYLRLTV